MMEETCLLWANASPPAWHEKCVHPQWPLIWSNNQLELSFNFSIMATLTPSLNGAGVPLPPNPANPPSLADIKSAKEYIDWLSFSKGQPAYQLNAATDGEIGAAEAYKMAVIFAHSPG